MKTITAKQTEIKTANKLLTRNDLLKLITESPSERGIDITEMRKRSRILDAIEKADGGDINLEDSDFEHLKMLFNKYPFLAPSKDVIELADHLDEISKKK